MDRPRFAATASPILFLLFPVTFAGCGAPVEETASQEQANTTSTACEPLTCAHVGVACGALPDGCGGSLACACASPCPDVVAVKPTYPDDDALPRTPHDLFATVASLAGSGRTLGARDAAEIAWDAARLDHALGTADVSRWAQLPSTNQSSASVFTWPFRREGVACSDRAVARLLLARRELTRRHTPVDGVFEQMLPQALGEFVVGDRPHAPAGASLAANAIVPPRFGGSWRTDPQLVMRALDGNRDGTLTSEELGSKSDPWYWRENTNLGWGNFTDSAVQPVAVFDLFDAMRGVHSVSTSSARLTWAAPLGLLTDGGSGVVYKTNVWSIETGSDHGWCRPLEATVADAFAGRSSGTRLTIEDQRRNAGFYQSAFSFFEWNASLYFLTTSGVWKMNGNQPSQQWARVIGPAQDRVPPTLVWRSAQDGSGFRVGRYVYQFRIEDSGSVDYDSRAYPSVPLSLHRYDLLTNTSQVIARRAAAGSPPSSSLLDIPSEGWLEANAGDSDAGAVVQFGKSFALWSFDVATSAFTRLPPPPVETVRGVLVRTPTKLFMLGGYRKVSTGPQSGEPLVVPSQAVQSYDFGSQSWRDEGTLPVWMSKGQTTVFRDGSRSYVAGNRAAGAPPRETPGYFAYELRE